MRLERYDGPESLREAIGALKEKLREQKYQSLNRAFTVWVCRVLKNRLAHQVSIPEANDLEEVDTMLAERFGEWTEQMMEKGMLAGLQKGRMEGEQQKAYDIAKNLLQEKLPAETVVRLTGLSFEEVKRLAAELS
jgi:predicted transposase/invertase (TIGR01784 family)